MKKLGLICLVFLVALTIMGAAYAVWTQNLSVTGTVSTGTYIVTVAQNDTATAANDSGPIGLSGTATVTIGPVTGTGTNAGFSVTIANGFDC
jgi:nitrogen fixation protein FixH